MNIKALSIRTNWTYKLMRNVMQTWREYFIWTSESRPTSITCNVWSTIRHEPDFVSFFVNTKGIRDDVWTTVFIVRQCEQAKLLINDRQSPLK